MILRARGVLMVGMPVVAGLLTAACAGGAAPPADVVSVDRPAARPTTLSLERAEPFEVLVVAEQLAAAAEAEAYDKRPTSNAAGAGGEPEMDDAIGWIVSRASR